MILILAGVAGAVLLPTELRSHAEVSKSIAGHRRGHGLGSSPVEDTCNFQVLI